MSISLTFGLNANRAVVSQFSLKVIEDILRVAGLSSALITSTSRTPAQQARVMFTNIVQQGVAQQKQLYGAAGDKVIDVFVEGKAKGKNPEQIRAAMEAKIIALGPTTVSHHVADPKKLNVIDIAPSSIAKRQAFIDAVKAEGRVRKFLQPPNDPAYHLEIPQPV